MAMSQNPWDGGGPPPVTPGGTDQGYATKSSPNGVTAPAAQNPWYSNSAYVPGWTPNSGIMGNPTYGSATSGAQQVGAGQVSDWSITPNGLMFRMGNNAASDPTQVRVLQMAAGYMQRGLSEQQAYDLAASEMRQRVAQSGAAPSTFTILPYQQGMLQAYANAGGDLGTLAHTNAAFTNWLNQAATWTGNGWRDAGHGDLTGQAPGQQQNGQNPAQSPANYSPGDSTQTAQQQQGGAGYGGLTSAQKAAMAADPQMAFRYMMKQMGYNPDAPGLFGRFMQQTFEPGWESYVAAQGLGNQGYADNLGQYMQQFTGALGGSGFDQFMRNATQSALANPNLRSYLNALPDQTQAEQYMQQLAAGQNFGANPLVQNALKSLYDIATNQYVDYSFGLNGGAPPTNPQMFYDWIKSNYPNYGLIF